MKWTGEQVENLYLQAIVVRRDLLSIRDLREEHLPLLRNIYSKCTKAIKENYNVPSSKLRIYCHYQPSYYHLHIHFSALSFEAPGKEICNWEIMLIISFIYEYFQFSLY
ncbi:m7GpppX diphosphatase [Armadillidium nasatum]|uniref:M7GpppX diphosphatase n=1 Tax=Armadillidium nasatum TaxID=96803 RepID=A0A5N5T536_9CRUS|nr:m7GpppX diphosphatase [Armadillidium nasatum]